MIAAALAAALAHAAAAANATDPVPSSASTIESIVPDEADEAAAGVCADDEDTSLSCRLRRADARVRERFAGRGPLRIVWSGLLMVDLAGPNSDLTENDNIQLRRLRVGFDRHFDAWTMRGYAEYKTGRLELEEFLLQRRWGDGLVVLGNQTEPFGLERVSSISGTTQLERALPVALTQGLDVGALYARRDGGWYWALGLFAPGSRNDGVRNKGPALDGRFAWSDVGDDDMRHFGAALSFRPQSSDSEVQFRSYPEVGLANVYLVDTGKFAGVDRSRRAGVEYAEVAGGWSWQAEAMAMRLSRIDGAPDLAFHGAYAEISWFPWEGRREYDAQQARFAVPAAVGHATWQFSARLSRVDLSSHDVDGGRETNLTLAANWYLTPRARLAANAVRVLQLDGGPFRGDTHGDYAFVVRLQYDLF